MEAAEAAEKKRAEEERKVRQKLGLEEMESDESVGDNDDGILVTVMNIVEVGSSSLSNSTIPGIQKEKVSVIAASSAASSSQDRYCCGNRILGEVGRIRSSCF